MKEFGWIEITGWNKFQHYSDERRPVWIKVYLDLLHNDDYLALSGHDRAVLHGLWMLYAATGRQLRANTRSLTRQLGLRVSSRQLASLNHAGFIEVSASKPLAQRESKRKKRVVNRTKNEQPELLDFRSALEELQAVAVA